MPGHGIVDGDDATVGGVGKVAASLLLGFERNLIVGGLDLRGHGAPDGDAIYPLGWVFLVVDG